MKTTTSSLLTSTVSFFALCASAAACGPGGGYQYNSYPVYQSTSSISQPAIVSVPRPVVNTAAPAPGNTALRSLAAPAAPTARISLVPAAATNAAPVGRLQIASAVATTSTPTASIHEVPANDTTPAIVKDEPKANISLAKVEPKTEEPIAKVEPKTDDTLAKVEPKTDEETTKVEPKTDDAVAAVEPKSDIDLSKSLDALNSPKEDVSKIADAIKGLVGTWMAVSRQGDGELSTVELKLDDNGWATLTVPGADGKSSTTTRKVEFNNNELKLTGADADVTLGKLVSFDSRQMVLDRSGSQVTFVRP